MRCPKGQGSKKITKFAEREKEEKELTLAHVHGTKSASKELSGKEGEKREKAAKRPRGDSKGENPHVQLG